MTDSTADVQTIVDPRDAAESAGLKYASDSRPGIRRRNPGRALPTCGRTARNIRAAASKTSKSAGHSSRMDGRVDQSGGSRTHPGDWPGRKGAKAVPVPSAVSGGPESTKYEHVMAFADALPHPGEGSRAHGSARFAAREGPGHRCSSFGDHAQTPPHIWSCHRINTEWKLGDQGRFRPFSHAPGCHYPRALTRRSSTVHTFDLS